MQVSKCWAGLGGGGGGGQTRSFVYTLPRLLGHGLPPPARQNSLIKAADSSLPAQLSLKTQRRGKGEHKRHFHWKILSSPTETIQMFFPKPQEENHFGTLCMNIRDKVPDSELCRPSETPGLSSLLGAGCSQRPPAAGQPCFLRVHAGVNKTQESESHRTGRSRGPQLPAGRSARLSPAPGAGNRGSPAGQAYPAADGLPSASGGTQRRKRQGEPTVP